MDGAGGPPERGRPRDGHPVDRNEEARRRRGDDDFVLDRKCRGVGPRAVAPESVALCPVVRPGLECVADGTGALRGWSAERVHGALLAPERKRGGIWSCVELEVKRRGRCIKPRLALRGERCTMRGGARAAPGVGLAPPTKPTEGGGRG